MAFTTSSNFAVILLALLQVDAFGGCLCPDLTKVQTGDLQINGGTLESQKWTVLEDRVELELKVSDVKKDFNLSVLGMGIQSSEYVELSKLAKANGSEAGNPKAKGEANGVALPAPEVKQLRKGSAEEIRLTWRMGSAVASGSTLKLSWNLTAAGADGPAYSDPQLVQDFCIDAAMKKALTVKNTNQSKYSGYLRVDLVISEAMAHAMVLQIQRFDGPISLCASNVKKTGKNSFEIGGRTNLQDKNGILPIMFARDI